jgi:hypothetical protein
MSLLIVQNMDPLSEIIALLRPNAAISKPITARGRWSVRYRAHEAPGFTLILAGQAWVTSSPRRCALRRVIFC